MYYLGVDIGGTNTEVGLLKDLDRLDKISIKTKAPRSSEEIAEDIREVVFEILKKNDLTLDHLDYVGVGIPGIIKDGIVHYASNLGFVNEPFAQILEQKIGKRVLLVNDGNAAALGEQLAGAGRGYKSSISISIGTGIGGGIILDNQIWEGFNGAAGEIGHTVIVAKGRECSCGKLGCMEAYCSAKSLVKITKECLQKDKASILNNCESLNVKEIFEAFHSGDHLGIRIVNDFIFYLSIGISNMVNVIQPQLICLNGGVSKQGRVLVEPLELLVAEQTYISNPEWRTKITTSQLGSEAGYIGAALLDYK